MKKTTFYESIKNDTNENNIQLGEVHLSNLADLIALPPNKEVAELLQKWSDYTMEFADCSKAEYLDTITELESAYRNELDKWNECYEKTEKLKQRHSSSWIHDMEKEYGLQYIKDNRKAILSNIKIAIGYHDSQCKEIDAILLYREAELYTASRNYIELFFDFYESLERHEKKVLRTRKKAMESLLSLINNNFIADLLFGPTPPARIIGDIQAKNRNPDLYYWFKEHINPDNFNPRKAMEELDRITWGDN